MNLFKYSAFIVAISCAVVMSMAQASSVVPEDKDFAYYYDASVVGIKNTDLPTKGMKTYGATDKAASEKKISDAQDKILAELKKQFCDQFPKRNLCSTLPKDNTDFSSQFVYMFLLAAAQNSFDVFSWQSFVAMNWPVGSDGLPRTETIGGLPSSPRAWMNYKTPEQVFDTGYSRSICDDVEDDEEVYLITNRFVQTNGQPLIDKNNNAVVYDIRINDVMEDYLLQNNLIMPEGQQAFLESGRAIDYPVGYYDDPINKFGGQLGRRL